MVKGLQRSIGRTPKSRIGESAQQSPQKLAITIEDNVSIVATGAAIGFGSVVLDDFPEGNILVTGAVISLTLTGPTSDDLADTWDGDFGVGSTPASDATITSADEDIIPESALGAATAEVSPTIRATLAAPVTLDNTDGSLEINLNVLVDAADIVDDKTVILAATGTLDLSYAVLGDD